MKTLGRTCLLEANLILVAGVTNTYRLRWLRRVTDKNGVTVVRPMDLTGWTPHMQVRRDGLTVIDLAPYTLLDTDGTITIRVPDEATQGLPAGAGAWDLLLEDPSGDVTRLAAGPALVETTVTPKGVRIDPRIGRLLVRRGAGNHPRGRGHRRREHRLRHRRGHRQPVPNTNRR